MDLLYILTTPMHKALISDIFGKTTALENIGERIGNDVDIIDPYAGKPMHFSSEIQAYDFFMSNVGLDGYCELLQARLNICRSPCILVGFSVGASAVWRISEKSTVKKACRAICFYGSQIRYHPEISPDVPVTCIFPRYEPRFDLEDLITRLSGKKRVSVHKTPYLHGFMNKISINYSPSGCAEYIDRLRQSKC